MIMMTMMMIMDCTTEEWDTQQIGVVGDDDDDILMKTLMMTLVMVMMLTLPIQYWDAWQVNNVLFDYYDDNDGLGNGGLTWDTFLLINDDTALSGLEGN